MRTCILHIGMPKTGTMSIQASLGQAASIPGARYISFGRQTNCSAALMEIFSGEVPLFERQRRTHWSEEAKAAEPARLLRHLRAAFVDEYDLFLMSGEQLHNMKLPALQAVKEELDSQMDQVRVVAYVRDAASWIESAFQQRVKTGDPADFNNLRKVLPEYRKKLERFDQAFGRENVTLWKFDPATFTGHDVVLDFCQRLGLPFDASQVIVDNEGVSRDRLGLLYLYRRYGKPAMLSAADKQDVRMLMRHTSSLAGDKLRMAPEVLAPYLEEIAVDMAWMEGRLGASVSAPPARRPGAVREEAELLTPTAPALAWLSEQIGRPLPASTTPQAAAAAMNEMLAEIKAQAKAARAALKAD